MKQKIFSLFALFALLLSLCAFPAAATEPAPLLRVFDYADLLTDEEEKDLSDRIAELTGSWGLDVVILTNATGYGEKDVAAFADDFYDENGCGVGEDRSGILFLVDLSERDLYFSTCGKAIGVFTDYGLNQLYNAVVSYFSNGDYAGGFWRFLREIPDYAAAYQKGEPIDLISGESGDFVYAERKDPKKNPTTYVVIAAIAFVISLIVMSLVRRGMNTARVSVNANDCLVGSSLNFRRKADRFLHSRTSRIYHSSSSDRSGGGGGSSTHSSSHGVSHGGGGGKF
ncbi:MAG: TPM domain-containing protein [Clostridia bacterium]|nr:TPM domain-containing protein [Clostridia bacterium]